MAIYHLSVKAVSRSQGRSATAAAAYRAGCRIADERTGEIFDYSRRGGVDDSVIVLPDGAPSWATDRAALWNAAEKAEKRKDACVAREFEGALPDELPPSERRRLAVDFAQEMAQREGCAVDIALHAPGSKGDMRNHHFHLLRSTRVMTPDGFGGKLETEKAGRDRRADLEWYRARWAELVNERLMENGINARVDHRSLKDQGIDRAPTVHLGPTASAIERRTGQKSGRRQEAEDSLRAQRELAAELSSVDDEISLLESALKKTKAVMKTAMDQMSTVARKLEQLFSRREPEPEQAPATPPPQSVAKPEAEPVNYNQLPQSPAEKINPSRMTDDERDKLGGILDQLNRRNRERENGGQEKAPEKVRKPRKPDDGYSM